jgi:hypothetical protein
MATELFRLQKIFNEMRVCDTKAYSSHLNEAKMMILSGSKEVYDGFKRILDFCYFQAGKISLPRFFYS